MKKCNKIICWVGGIIVVLLIISILGGSIYLLSYALFPAKNKGRDYTAQYRLMRKRYPWAVSWMDSVQRTKALRDTSVVMKNEQTGLLLADSTRLHALIIPAPKKDPRTVVLVPGYTDNAVDMLHFACFYNRELGMNVVIPELHANGKSGGEAMQMGWNDRHDVLRWASIADSLFRDATGHARIVIHGWSMGGATTMNYTSAWDEFSYELTETFGLSDFPLLYSASALCKIAFGWSFGEASPLKQVAQCHKPMLLIHGGNDTFVPTRMIYPLYAAKPAPKMMIVFHGSKHAKSFKDHRELYSRWVKRFLERYL